MIKVIKNTSEDFYNLLGPVFGSRAIQRKTKDRIYDDDNKSWFVYIDKTECLGLVSVSDNVIKNIWSDDDDILLELLLYVKSKLTIKESIVPIVYKDIYKKANLKILDNNLVNYSTILGGKE